MDAVRLGFVGYGIMGERLLRAALSQDPGVLAVAGVWDPAAAAMERLARDLPDVAQFGSVDEMIAAAECVYVASPPASHLGHARRALAAGRAVFCEKPLAADLDDARAFVTEVEGSGARVAVNFPFASSFAVDQIHDWLAEGAVGTVRRLSIEVAFAAWPRSWQRDAARWLDGRAEGGFTREVVSHFLFLARRLLGPLQLESASAEYPGDGVSERGIEAVLTAGGVPVSLTGRVGGTDKDDHNAFTLEGDGGSIRVRDWAFAERLVGDIWTASPDALPNERMRPLVLARQLAKVAALTRGESQNLATAREALDVQEVVETILQGRSQKK
jgi:predicted dehydrogenase